MIHSEFLKWLKGLRKFQRTTIYHTIRHLLENQRFLVADEVGLGKTKIARGVIGFFLSFKQTEKPVRVVYLCANQQLAWQNIQSFRFFDGESDKENCCSDLRLGLLSWRLGTDKQYNKAKRLQLWALTPGTSFEIQNGAGTMEERALITGIIDPELRTADFKAVMDSFSKFGRDEVVSKTWSDRWIDGELRTPKNRDVIFGIRNQIADYFQRDSRELEKFRRYYCPAETTTDYFWLLSRIFVGYSAVRKELPERRKKADYPGSPLHFMRRILAEIGIMELNPDLIIMDEFQRYDRLLFQNRADSEQSLFGHFMNACSSHEGRNKTCFLLLSATPYSSYANAAEDWGCSLKPHEGFIQLMTWLAHGRDEISELLRAYAQSFSEGKIPELENSKLNLEKQLLKYMCRTERRDFADTGKKTETLHSMFPDSLWTNREEAVIASAAKEVVRYQGAYQASQNRGGFNWHELLTYAKYASRPLSFLQDYKLSEKASQNREYLTPLYYSNADELSQCCDSRIQKVSAILGELKNLLWIPPTNPRRPLSGDFAGLESKGLSKILIFSSWRFIPRMVSIILSAQMPKRDFTNTWDESYQTNPNSKCELLDGQEPWHPAQALFTAITRYFQNSASGEKKKKIVNDFVKEFGSRIFCHHSFNDVARKDFARNGFSKAMIDYCRDGCLEDVFDEYVYMIFQQSGGEISSLEKYFSKQYLRIPSSLHVTFSQDAQGNGTMTKYMSDCFGERNIKHNVSRNLEELEMGGSMSHLQRAFNSPFAPFVLSTTSIGQEGLDFHWYCRKIIHWNIPDNPIEFEQRNGRINRYHGLSVRQSIVGEMSRAGRKWDEIFDDAQEKYKGIDASGIQPHWLISNPSFPIEQFAFYLPGSQDEECLRRVCMQLGIYRVALGQPHQEDFLKRLKNIEILKKYALCLQPPEKHD